MRVDDRWIKDDDGRTLILRGANLSGSTKVPYTPNGATSIRDTFFQHKDVSFIGKPFPLEDADEHLSRLKAWGLTFLRFLITWEAVEHAGPGQYDEDYLDYIHAVLEKANDYGIHCFIDPHQDVWSRWTGGDGAPGWTLEAVGFDITRLHETGAAITHATHGDPFPRMVWPTNYSKLGAATMFTLFFAGDDFASQTKIDGVSTREFLQGHYINAMRHVAERLNDLPNVYGFDTLNEPGSGYIGVENLSQYGQTILMMGETPTPFQTMLLGAGYPQEVAVMEMGFNGLKQAGTVTVNPDGVNVWRDDCIWKQNGVWTDADGAPQLLKPDYFTQVGGRNVEFARDYLKPFMLRYVDAIRSVKSSFMIFIEGVPGGDHPDWATDDPDNVVNAAHWYDALTLFMKQFNPEFTINMFNGQMEAVSGREAVAQAFVEQIAAQKRIAQEHMNDMPTLIGEFGIPFDLDNKGAYASGDFSTHEYALDLYYDAMDANLLHCTIWNYTPDNTNERGDLWNDEDLSIFSRDQQNKDWHEDIHAGGRGLRGVVRPYAQRVAGEPIEMRFDLETRQFVLVFKPDQSIAVPTEIFVPDYQYPDGYEVVVSNGEYEIEERLVRIWSGEDKYINVTISPA